jgi:hypothetical protein
MSLHRLTDAEASEKKLLEASMGIVSNGTPASSGPFVALLLSVPNIEEYV